LKHLPAVDEAVRALTGLEGVPRWAVVQAVREEIDALRQQLLSEEAAPGPEVLEPARSGGAPLGSEAERAKLDPARVELRIGWLLTPSLRPVFNATGVVIHTNLGRAPLSASVLEHIVRVARGYSNLEYELDQRRRGSRHLHAAELICQLTGAEDAVVVNNNAAAVFLVLASLAAGREVVVSRGELIEIGGSFRLPDVMTASGAILREVGTTNRTHPADYEGAINERTALLLKAHRSNFAVVGFTAEVQSAELTAMGREHGVPTMYDLGSGCLLDPAQLGLPGTETVQQAVACGFDLVSFSGDKLLGGPQAGIIVGRKAWIGRLRSHPLMRPLRPDKLTLAGLLATLELYRDGAALQLPVLRMLATPEAELRQRAEQLRQDLTRELGAPWVVEPVPVGSRVGGGAMPTASPASWAVAIGHPQRSADVIEGALRLADPPVIARIEEDRLLLDLRTLDPAEQAQLTRTVAAALGDRG